MSRFEPKLSDVPETMLWTLYTRANEAMRKDGIIDDPKCIEIYNSIDYDFAANFGQPEPTHAVRSVSFDQVVNDFIQEHPKATIVNLGEGLETQRYRIAKNDCRWLSVDLPEAIEVRQRFIESDEQYRHLAMSALDRSWFDHVRQDESVLVTAQGLFMYFQEEEVKALLQDIVDRFDHGYIAFDAISNTVSDMTMHSDGFRVTNSYRTPKMPWGASKDQLTDSLAEWLPGLEVHYLPFEFPRGPKKWFMKMTKNIGVFSNLLPTLVLMEFGGPLDRGYQGS